MVSFQAARILVAQLGARRHYAVPRALHQAGLLERLVTDACAGIAPWRWLDKLLPAQVRPVGLRRLLGRRIPDIPVDRIHGFPLFALSASWERRRGEAQTDYWARRNACFGRLVVGSGFGAADTVYAYNGAALEIFRAARDRGLRTVLDQTAAPWRWNARLLREEAERWPGWEDRPSEIDQSGRLADREEAEWALADRIVCGSAFAADALAEQGGPAECCAIVPYAGYLTGLASASGPRPVRRDGKLRVLFVGTLQLRKGIPYLLEARRRLRNEGVTFRLVGPSLLSESAMRELRREMEVVGPVPRSEIAAHYAWADVFVLPTLSEGSANVVYEAMAAGLPVITTPNAGSVIRDGEDGLLVPIRDAGALAGAIERLAMDHGLWEGMGGVGATRLARVVVEDYASALAGELKSV